MSFATAGASGACGSRSNAIGKREERNRDSAVADAPQSPTTTLNCSGNHSSTFRRVRSTTTSSSAKRSFTATAASAVMRRGFTTRPRPSPNGTRGWRATVGGGWTPDSPERNPATIATLASRITDNQNDERIFLHSASQNYARLAPGTRELIAQTSATNKKFATSELPPYEMNGSVIPVSGKSPITPPTMTTI